MNLTLSYTLERLGPAGKTTIKSSQIIPLDNLERIKLSRIVTSPNSETLQINKTFNPFLLNKLQGLSVAQDFNPRKIYEVLPSCQFSLNGDKDVYWSFVCSHTNMTSNNMIQTGPYFYIQRYNFLF
jgi:hypothetical protein